MSKNNSLVLLHIMTRNGQEMLPLHLKCIADQTYPKENIILYIRTNDNTDNTVEILKKWLEIHGPEYRKVIFDDSPSLFKPSFLGNHLWHSERLDLIRHLRDKGLVTARDENADFCFSFDTDNFIIPETLESLVNLNLPVVAPLLRYVVNEEENLQVPERLRNVACYTYANFTNKVDPSFGDTFDYLNGGEEKYPPGYMDILYRKYPGVHPVELVHCTYLVNKDVFSRVSYQNGCAGGYDYIIFAYNLRISGIPQYLDNRKNYGCLTMASTTKTAEKFTTQLYNNELPEEWFPNYL